MRSKPRTEIFFPAVQTASDTDYVPVPTRDEKLARQFEGGPRGIVIARYQHIGSLAALKTFEHMVDNDVSPDDFLARQTCSR